LKTSRLPESPVRLIATESGPRCNALRPGCVTTQCIASSSIRSLVLPLPLSAPARFFSHPPFAVGRLASPSAKSGASLVHVSSPVSSNAGFRERVRLSTVMSRVCSSRAVDHTPSFPTFFRGSSPLPFFSLPPQPLPWRCRQHTAPPYSFQFPPLFARFSFSSPRVCRPSKRIRGH